MQMFLFLPIFHISNVLGRLTHGYMILRVFLEIVFYFLKWHPKRDQMNYSSKDNNIRKQRSLLRNSYGPDAVRFQRSLHHLQFVIVFLFLKPLDTFGTWKHKQSSQIYQLITGFTEGNGERLLLKYYSMKCFTFLENINKK